MLWLCLRFHRLALDVFTPSVQGSPETALAIIERHRIHAANAPALALGIRTGMSAGSALALSDTLKLREREPALEAAALEELAEWACGLSSQVSVSRPDRLLIEIGASLRLFGGIVSLLQSIDKGLTARGHAAQQGLGPTPLSAELLAHALPSSPTAPPPWARAHDPEAFRKSLHALPIEALDAPDKQQLAMQRMGLTRIGDVLALPGAALGRRFGREFIAYLARLSGERPDPRPLYRPREQFLGRMQFLEPLADASMLLFPMQRLLGDMGRFLDRRQRYCQRLEWRLGMRAGAQTLPIACSLQQNRLDALLGLTRLALEQFRLRAPVESLELACSESAELKGEEGNLFGNSHDADPEAEQLLLDRLRLRLGNERVHGLYLRDSHLPEQSWSSVREPFAPGLQATPPLRPCWLLEEPLPLDEKNGLPAWNGSIALLSGPERIDTAWWSTPQRRDYFVGQHEDGALVWVFRERTSGQWFAQGVFG